MSETRTPEEEAIVKLEAQNARLRADLAALVPLARAMVAHLKLTAVATDLRQLEHAEAVLAAYDKEG